MPNLAEFRDSDSVDSVYAARAVVYVEGTEDRKVFARLIGMRASQQVDFKVPRNNQGGWAGVCDQVSMERENGNENVYGLVDGDTAACLGLWRDLIDAEGVVFNLHTRQGILSLADQELENLLIRYGGICDYLANDVSLRNLSTRTKGDIEKTLRRLTRRFFLAAVFKYVVQHFHHHELQFPRIDFGKLQDPSFSTGKLRVELRKQTSGDHGSWERFVKEVYAILGALRSRFRDENMSQSLRDLHLRRLADGKELLKGMKTCYRTRGNVDGHLVAELIGSQYAGEFRCAILRAVGLVD